MELSGFLVEKTVLYYQDTVHGVHEDGSTNYEEIVDTFDTEYDDETPERWRIHEQGSFFDEINDGPTGLTFEELKDYLEYEGGWLETHDQSDKIGWQDWKNNIKGKE